MCIYRTYKLYFTILFEKKENAGDRNEIEMRNENIKSSGFYTLQVTREYCDLLELWSAWVGDSR